MLTVTPETGRPSPSTTRPADGRPFDLLVSGVGGRPCWAVANGDNATHKTAEVTMLHLTDFTFVPPSPSLKVSGIVLLNGS
jgi:hypothetical protein